jgi:Family of unknown function (DUF5681)
MPGARLYFALTRFENGLEVRGNRTGRGWFKKGQSGNPSGLPKNPPSPERRLEEQARREVYREVSNIVVEARMQTDSEETVLYRVSAI